MFSHFFITCEGQKACNQMQLSKINSMQAIQGKRKGKKHLEEEEEEELQAVPSQGAIKHTSARFPLLVLILNQEQIFSVETL